MKNIKLWLYGKEMGYMVDKIMERLTEINVSASSPCAGITRENCPDYILNKLKKEIEDYGTKPAADLNDMRLAFVFGLPLTDTVFMLAGCQYPESLAPPTVECNMEHNGGASDSYEVMLYKHIGQ